MMSRYGIVSGQGRSGTNWVLDILDASRETFCRNEPNVIPGSPFERLPPLWRMADRDLLAAEWESVAAETCQMVGERDHRLKVNKHYLHPVATKLGLPPLMARPKIRNFAGKTILRDLDAHRWELPRLIGSRVRLAEACTVIKVNRVPLLLDWLLSERPDVPIINIIRHPCGRHASYSKRYLSSADAEAECILWRQRLKQIAEDDEVWGERFGVVDSMSLVACHTWLWRFVNETIDDAGQGKPNYLGIVFEDMTADPMAHARSAYDLFGLEWTPEVEGRIESGLQDSVWGKLAGTPEQVASAWKENLRSEDVIEIERILADSPMSSWWT